MRLKVALEGCLVAIKRTEDYLEFVLVRICVAKLLGEGAARWGPVCPKVNGNEFEVTESISGTEFLLLEYDFRAEDVFDCFH